MNWSVIVANVFSGGFLKGKRTVLLALASLVSMVASYAVGDLSLVDFINASRDQILLTLGIVTAAASGNS